MEEEDRGEEEECRVGGVEEAGAEGGGVKLHKIQILSSSTHWREGLPGRDRVLVDVKLKQF